VRRVLAVAVLALVLASPALGSGARTAKPGKKSPSSLFPDFDRYVGTWLWVRSEGMAAESNPGTRGATRTLLMRPDLQYELHQRRGTRDSVLCHGPYLVSEQTENGGGTISAIDFEGWHEAYERRMIADFDGPDTLHLIGYPCENCPDHVYVRGRSAIFEGEVQDGATYTHPLWDGLRFELVPWDEGWEIAVRDSTRPDENLARLTLPLHGPNPRQIEPSAVGGKSGVGGVPFPTLPPVRGFIFSREVGATIQGPKATEDPTPDEIERIEDTGRGWLEILNDAPAGTSRAAAPPLRFRAAVEEVMTRRTP